MQRRGLIDAQVSWDLNGNFSTRQDLRQGLTESFVYDPLNRLDDSTRNGTTNLDVTLDAIGNVTWKSGVTSYNLPGAWAQASASNTKWPSGRLAGPPIYSPHLQSRQSHP